jgi:hypothetical protein
MPYEFRIPAPYPGAGSRRLSLQGADLIVTFPALAQDAAPKFPRDALPGAAGGKAARDQDGPDDNGNGRVFETAAQAA